LQKINLFTYINNISDKLYILIDQSIVSLGNFLLTILILKFLGIKSYGIFSFFWLTILFINSTQLSFLIYPMMTNSSKQKIGELDLFYGSIFIHQVAFTIVVLFLVFLALNCIQIILGELTIKIFYLPFICSIFFTQIYQFFRRLLLNKKNFLWAIFSDFTVFSSLIVAIIYLNYLEKLNLENIIWTFAFSFSLGLIICSPIIINFKITAISIVKIFKENYKIGKWLLLTSILQWIYGNLWVVNAGIILGAFTLGVIRACQTLIGVTNLFFQSIENLIPAQTSKIYINEGKKGMKIYLRSFTYKGLIISIFMTITITIFSKLIIGFVYGDEIVDFYYYLILFSLMLPVTFFQYPSIYGLRTLGKTRPIFLSYLASSIFALIASSTVINNYGLSGFFIGLFTSQIIVTGSIYLNFRKIF